MEPKDNSKTKNIKVGGVNFLVKFDKEYMSAFYDIAQKNNFNFEDKDAVSFAIIHKAFQNYSKETLINIINHQTHYVLSMVMEDIEYYSLEEYFGELEIVPTIEQRIAKITQDGYEDMVDTILKTEITSDDKPAGEKEDKIYAEKFKTLLDDHDLVNNMINTITGNPIISNNFKEMVKSLMGSSDNLNYLAEIGSKIKPFMHETVSETLASQPNIYMNNAVVPLMQSYNGEIINNGNNGNEANNNEASINNNDKSNDNNKKS